MSDSPKHAEKRLTLRPAIRDRIGLCLSGDGVRAALFQAGTLCRLNELGLLSQVSAVACVSGGSLAGAVLASNWRRLRVNASGVFENLDEIVVAPIERLAQSNLRLDSRTGEWLNPWCWPSLWRGEDTRLDRLIRRLDRRLLHGARLMDLPQQPRFVFLSTNLGTGGLWESGRARIGERSLGYLRPGRLRLSEVVAASAAHPLRFPPLLYSTNPRAFTGGSLGAQADALRRHIWLADGSLVDSLGIAALSHAHRTIICSDGGRVASADSHYHDWLGNRLLRAWEITGQASHETRKRWLIGLFVDGRRGGTYLGLGSYHGDYGLAGSVGYPADIVGEIASVSTGWTVFSRETAMILVNHAYTLADTALCRHLADRIEGVTPLRLPYPDLVDQRDVLSVLSQGHTELPMPRAA